MADQSILVDGDILWAGIRRASSRTKEPILCILRGEAMSFVAPGGLRLVVLWQFDLKHRLSDNAIFTIPPMIASFLATEAIRDTIEIEVDDEEMVTLVTQDPWGRYELRWRSDVSAFTAPEEFNRLLAKPSHLLEVSYLQFSDTVHEAVAKLVSMEERQIHPTKLAILVDIAHPTLRINGQEIEAGTRNQYYFDPRLIIRALEFIKSNMVQVGFTQVAEPNRAFLSILAKQDGYTIHCALLSIGAETQRLYPLPPKSR